MTTRSKEEQIDAAMAALKDVGGFGLFDRARCEMRKLLDGHYAEPELPQIVHPGKAWNTPTLQHRRDGWAVHAATAPYSGGFAYLIGPVHADRKDAVNAWNEGLSR